METITVVRNMEVLSGMKQCETRCCHVVAGLWWGRRPSRRGTCRNLPARPGGSWHPSRPRVLRCAPMYRLRSILIALLGVSLVSCKVSSRPGDAVDAAETPGAD